MATAVVAAGLRQARLPDLTGALLAVAASMLVILVAVSCWRALAFPGCLRAWLSRPCLAFSSYAVVAACAVLSAGLGFTWPASPDRLHLTGFQTNRAARQMFILRS
jgi:hypothetical protein